MRVQHTTLSSNPLYGYSGELFFSMDYDRLMGVDWLAVAVRGREYLPVDIPSTLGRNHHEM